MSSVPLYGRRSELGALESRLDAAGPGGGALVVRGEAGIGKSALLDAAVASASARGIAVLRTAGTRSEAHLPFAGLHRLLQPLLGQLGRLPGPQRAAVEAAFGMSDSAAPDVFFTALATLELLGDAAERAPLLVIAEDAQWLDRPTGEVLAFVGRRVALEPIVLLLAVRDGGADAFVSAGLDELWVPPLDLVAAAELLDSVTRDLAPAVRERLLAEAAGNPLALIELPVAIGSDELMGATLPEHLPLSARLERAFAARLPELPRVTRTLLLAAAANDGAAAAEALEAAAIVEAAPVGADTFEMAAAAGLVELDGTELRFRHPLVRSAVYQAATPADRRAMHVALAAVLADQPERSLWHRSAAATGADEDLARGLEATALDAERRGATSSALAALERAAQLGADHGRAVGRLLGAAELLCH